MPTDAAPQGMDPDLTGPTIMDPIEVARWDELPDRQPVGTTAEGITLVIVRFGDEHSVLFGRCQHRGALLADGRCVGDDLVCGLHGWDYRIDTGVSAYDPDQALHRFTSEVVDGGVVVDRRELVAYRRRHPISVMAAPDDAPGTEEYRFHDASPHLTPEEPAVGRIHELARNGLTKVGHDGPVGAMGVPHDRLPSWDGLQVLAAQLARFPLLEDEPVRADVTIGPRAARPLHLELPIFVSDMSYGALSEEAKTALGLGAQQAGTGICSGEGGMLPEEHDANERYFYELASGRFGWDPALLKTVQAVHIKLGQGAKTGTGGHLPGPKVVGRIAQVRGLPEGQSAISPARFVEWVDVESARLEVDMLRADGEGIPVGVKMSAQHIEDDIDAALFMGVDYIILDGRGGGTGAAPLIFRDQISVPTMAAIPRARAHLDRSGASDVTLVATGGIREAPDIMKALCLGADAVALANSAIQAIGCVGMRACHTDNCPVGIATQKPHLRARLPVQEAADRLARFLLATTDLVKILTGATGHRHVNELSAADLTTWDRDLAALTGVQYGGMAERYAPKTIAQNGVAR